MDTNETQARINALHILLQQLHDITMVHMETYFRVALTDTVSVALEAMNVLSMDEAQYLQDTFSVECTQFKDVLHLREKLRVELATLEDRG